MEITAPPVRARKRVFRLPERALIVDEQPGARHALRDVIVEMGIRQVDTARDPLQAIERIEAEPYPLVLSEVSFRGPVSGTQLMEVIRTRRLLPADAAFVLVVSEASRSLVATTSEWQPDALLLKPVVHAVVAPRIEQAIRRRVAYAPVHAASMKDDPAELLATVDALIARLGAPSIELLKWRTQALLAMGKLDEAQRSAEQALNQRRPLPWAQVAVAQVAHAQGLHDHAQAILEALIEADPYQGGAYDLLIKVHQAAGRSDQALAVARAAVKPLSTASRLRTLGEMAYAQDDLELAETCYSTLIQKTGATPVRSALDVGMLGQVLVTQGQASEALDLVSGTRTQWFEDPASQALAASVAAQAHGLRGDHENARTHARRALELAALEPASSGVGLLVAQGALTAGLGDEALALMHQILGHDPVSQVHSQPMAARVLRRAGFAVPEAAGPGPSGVSLRPHRLGAEGVGKATPDEPRGGYMQPAASPSPKAPEALQPAKPRQPPLQNTDSIHAQVAVQLQESEECLQKGHHAKAVEHAEAALARSPDHPLALLAVVRSQLLRMQAQGYDEAAAMEVQDCLRALERLIPGAAGRIFKGLLG